MLVLSFHLIMMEAQILNTIYKCLYGDLWITDNTKNHGDNQERGQNRVLVYI